MFFIFNNDKYFKFTEPVSVVGRLLIPISETLGLNLGRDIVRGFYKKNAGILRRLGYDRFHPDPIQGIILLSSFHSTLSCLAPESAIQNSQMNK